MVIAVGVIIILNWPRGGTVGPRDWVVPPSPMRVMRFVDPTLVRHSPRFRFTYDPVEALALLRAEEGLDGIVDGAANDLELSRRLLDWTRSQWEPGRPDPYPPLDARIILRDIRRGFTGGFCAQYNYVLVQSLQSLGYPARYVTVARHEVLEVWVRDEKRWVCLDPYYRATYIDEEGRALSVAELFERTRAGKPIIPAAGAIPGTSERVQQTFSRFRMWLKNDHVSNPVNFTDLPTYYLQYVPTGDAPPAGAGLWGSRLEDFYFDPDEIAGQ
jgi:hypothetical protein